MDYYNGLMNGILLPQKSGIKWNEVTDEWRQSMEFFVRNMPEFDFYTGNNYDLLSTDDVYIYNVKVWNAHIAHYRRAIGSATRFENKKDYVSACEIYEGHVMSKTWAPPFYLKLARIYHMSDLVSDERKLLNLAIDIFVQVKEDMANYIKSLGAKYGCLDYVNKRIAEGKKIVYYDGLFDLYNPYPEIEELGKMRDALKGSSK